MKKKNRGIEMACIFVAVIMMTSGCKAVAVDTENSVPIETSALTSVSETTKEPTETAAATTAKPTQKVTATPTPTVIETTVATTTKASETTAPAVTTKATTAPATTTKETTKPTPKPTKETTAETEAPAETAAPPVETAAPVATTAAPATDYTAMCADIRSKLIANLEANGKWDPNFTGTLASWGQKWWEVGYFEDNGMSAQAVADEYYNGKFSETTITACGVDCYVADGKIYLDYQGYHAT